MLNRFTPFAIACAMTSFVSIAAAQQPQQTAEGAQKFLSMLAKDEGLYVQVLEKNGVMSVAGTRTTTYRWLKNGVPQGDGPYADASEPITAPLKWMLRIGSVDSVDARANADHCSTRIDTSVDPRDKLGNVETSDSFIKKETFFGFDRLDYRRTVTDRYEDPAVKFAGPHYITWGKAVISRGSNGRLFATMQGARVDTQLVYIGDVRKDVEMTDRVEYAMKFLKASCDKTAATGF